MQLPKQVSHATTGSKLIADRLNRLKLSSARHLQVRSDGIVCFASDIDADTQTERDALIERVYPRLREFARSRGVDFQVASMYV